MKRRQCEHLLTKMGRQLFVSHNYGSHRTQHSEMGPLHNIEVYSGIQETFPVPMFSYVTVDGRMSVTTLLQSAGISASQARVLTARLRELLESVASE